ncbi:hypothetical protein YT1_2071 [Rhodococcus ruber]|nr:hypothetical protein YT1_2071 [Rhodococcus ruber]
MELDNDQSQVMVHRRPSRLRPVRAAQRFGVHDERSGDRAPGEKA